MKPSQAVVLLLLLSLFTPGFAQQAPSAPPPKSARQKDQATAPQAGDVVKIGVTLVQVDVTVTDKKGKPVTDLRAEDFEVLQNNRPQHITNFSYVAPATAAASATASASPEAAKVSGNKAAAEAPAPPPHLKAENIRRTIALVVDDLGLSFESTALVRLALKKFVDEQMQAGDLVAILRTAAGMGALQQFTNDKRMLYAAIERVRWSPSHGSINTFAPVVMDPLTAGVLPKQAAVGDPAFDLHGTIGKPDTVATQVDQLRQEVFAIGTLGALGFAVRGLRQLPGRKSIVLFSDVLRIYNREQSITRVQDALENLIDQANRAAVSFYTVDARGLAVLAMTAADDLSGDLEPLLTDPNKNTNYSKYMATIATGLTDRQREFRESQEGLRYLADRTGGIFVGNNNDLNHGIARALQDQTGYYLIGFVPDEATFKAKNGSREFQHIDVRLKREGLRLRSRNGFYGFTNEEDRPQAKSAVQQLLMALTSPFGLSDIHVKMTTQFWHDAKKGAFINALLHIDARDLVFEELANG